MKQEQTEQEIEERDDQAETLSAIKQGKRFKKNSHFIDVCRHIVAEKSLARFKGMAIDMYSASAFVAVYDRINDLNKAKLDAIADVNPSKAMGIIWQLIK